ncbi:hypothetical protein E3P92_02338 [Wallemia ichthyophaga]|uniref:Uncharacterized protein n=1 Tax=Wallemia ichthyophaga (strain EXF-994 / CBS 113033) TaxID=1299270 RepID=R9AKW6_WALI9|nr:uncharacterized protein J056_003421 [Wallemia ichthyophaga EXF-994]TIB13146.1 hypothetical protein E3P92_02338 [Wallemia ichthyophaga]EOR02859.1 hypothetical protein J056_003421 [Wallemia ichthyophaga EXF-994]TIB33854.1 hypothetical protein E3P84_01969 [Wallemia ichthyophaga]TIB41494.1 hypothetical protein E3P83_01921 [Wallemia ichthyophaga]TIB62934.1 hypothetical protein E3P78_02108 [Wallemia ichthyophaga]
MQLFVEQAKKSAEIDSNSVIQSHPRPPNEAAAFSKYHESHHLATCPYYPESKNLTGNEEIDYSPISPRATTYDQLTRKLRSTSISRRGSQIKSLSFGKAPQRRNSVHSTTSSTVISPTLGYKEDYGCADGYSGKLYK